ncbi:hypothetical protein BH23GEM3_BH23GEM3_25510 [soil metagenome]|nr:DUF2232 domain-containing protein [Gemmatimonadota bacterium]
MAGLAPESGTRERPEASASGPFARSSRRSHWGTAVALTAVVLLLGVFAAFPLIVLPLAVLLLGFAPRQRRSWVALGALAWALALVPGGGAQYLVSRGWALLLGGAFLLASLLRPRWGVFSRGLAAVAASLGVMGVWLAFGGRWERVDWAMTEHFRSIASLTAREFFGRFPDARWAADLSAIGGRMAEAQGVLFPALLALQSLAALTLAWWLFSQSRRGRALRSGVRPLREFRFHDSLVWVLAAGLLLLVLPGGEWAARAGYNLLVFMVVLYALRGVAVFVFLARGAPTATSLVLGALAAVFFYPLVFTAALLVGLGDTWLDVRRRAVAAARV